jgi:ADP-heptose:LPS heptosyltransferase
MASVLFLAPVDLGEAVLASGALAHIAKAADAVTVVATPEAAPLFRAVPGLRRVIVLPGDASLSDAASLYLNLMRARFDIVIDGRGGFLGRGAGKRRVALRARQAVQHRTEAWAEAVGSERVLPPALWLDDAARQAAAKVALGGGALLVLAPGGVSRQKRWPPERFAAVARRLHDGPLAGARIVVLGAAPRDAGATQSIVASLDADGVAARDLGVGLDLLAAAALLEGATLCIGNDNALTHIAAAAGAPTLTIFGATDERVRAPSGPRTRTLRGPSFEAIVALPALDAGAAMADVSIDAVETAALELLRTGGLR